MRAIHLLRKLDPAEWGGTETAILRLCDGLRENGVKPVVYCPRLERESTSDPLQLAGCKSPGIGLCSGAGVTPRAETTVSRCGGQHHVL